MFTNRNSFKRHLSGHKTRENKQLDIDNLENEVNLPLKVSVNTNPVTPLLVNNEERIIPTDLHNHLLVQIAKIKSEIQQKAIMFIIELYAKPHMATNIINNIL